MPGKRSAIGQHPAQPVLALEATGLQPGTPYGSYSGINGQSDGCLQVALADTGLHANRWSRYHSTPVLPAALRYSDFNGGDPKLLPKALRAEIDQLSCYLDCLPD